MTGQNRVGIIPLSVGDSLRVTGSDTGDGGTSWMLQAPARQVLTEP